MSVSVKTSARSASIPGDASVPVPQQHLARRTLAARPSEVRKVFRAAQRPGMISFANGAPYLGALPFERIAADAQRILLEGGERSFQYGSSDGIPELRDAVWSMSPGRLSTPTEVATANSGCPSACHRWTISAKAPPFLARCSPPLPRTPASISQKASN